jgi:hypothetical protein
MPHADATRLLEYEALALLERLSEVRPFALTLPMVAAASPSVAAQAAIEKFLTRGRRELRSLISSFLAWLRSPRGVTSTPAQAQQRFTAVRLRFLGIITQFDIFADALVERSQNGYGELVGGLDVAASEALELPGRLYACPPVICHLDRGAGAAIRRARTRLPGGGETPVAIIRVPRERMVGSAIASSLVHEVGHQGAELLDIVTPLREALGSIAERAGPAENAWRCFERWISEIIADFWSVARVGIASTLGLISVVSLPKPFVTRVSLEGPHPTPWIRVKISAAIGKALYPDLQWDRLAGLWDELYPLDQAAPSDAAAFRGLSAILPDFIRFLVNFPVKSAGGRPLASLFPREDRTPARLRALWQEQQRRADTLAHFSPTIAFAAVGQAKYDNALNASRESMLLRRLLRFWALRSTIDTQEVCASLRTPTGNALTV